MDLDLLDNIIVDLKTKIHNVTRNKEFLTINTQGLLNHYRLFTPEQKQIFSDLMSNIDVGFSDTIVTLSLGIPRAQFKLVVPANDTNFCNVLIGFYRLLSDIKDENRDKVIIKDSFLSGKLQSRTENCYRHTKSLGDINDLRSRAMRGIEMDGQDGGGSKSRRRHARKTRRGRGPTRKSKPKTHRCRRHSRIRKHHKKYTSRRRR